mgnify:CR=1 FL=1
MRELTVIVPVTLIRQDPLGCDVYVVATATADVWWSPARLSGPPELCYEEEGGIEIYSVTFAGPLPLDESHLTDQEWQAIESACIQTYMKEVTS